MCGDLDPFKEAAKQLVKLVQTRQDKHIRFFGDCAGFLFHNHHFEECLQLEAWGQERPFFGSYLCGYEKSLLIDSNDFGHNRYRRSILEVKHDSVVNAEEVVLGYRKFSHNNNNDYTLGGSLK
jgi:hypothetical protein